MAKKPTPAPTMQIEQWPIERLIEYDKNPRKNDHAVDRTADAINAFGFRVPLIAKSDGSLVDGHLRLKAARKLGMETVPVVLADDLTDAQIRAFRISVNKIADLAEWNTDLLTAELEALRLDDFNLDVIGFDMSELAGMLAEKTEGLTDEDAVPDAPAVPVTVEGDVWLLGRHRLLCGDSTSVDAVDKLMDGRKASIVVTDPPWNVAYGTNIASSNKQGYKKREILNDNFSSDAEWEEFLAGTTACIDAATLPGCPLYCVMGASEWPAIDKALRQAGFHWSSTIIWAKDQLVMSRKDYHTQYEPMWYGWKGDAARIWTVKNRKQSDLWRCARPKSSPLHPTTKPVEIAEIALLNSSNAGALAFEPFGGSGWMIIASEKNARDCNTMELDPKYCDVIITRWQDFTGLEATLESTGRTFAELKVERCKAVA